MTTKKIKQPASVLYYPIGGLAKLLAKPLFGLKIDKKDLNLPKKPFILISNHASKIDVLYSVVSVFPKKLNIVAGRDAFTWKILKPFLPYLHVIPKSQFGLDIAAIRDMQSALDGGCNLYICPEGKTSLDGKPIHYLPPSIGKFVKMTGAPVVVAKIEGSYLTMPRFASNIRRGKVKVTLKTIVSDEEAGQLKPLEIYNRIVEGLDYNDNIYQRQQHIRFRSKMPAKHLNYILYRCPKCGEEYQNEVEEDNRHLVCLACGNRVEYTEYGELIADEGSVCPDRLDKWYQMQRAAAHAELETGAVDETRKVELKTVNEKNDFLTVGEGTLTFTPQKIIYNGTMNGLNNVIDFPIQALHTITTKNKEGVDLMSGNVMYRFMFQDKKYSSKWGLLVEENYRIHNNIAEKETL